jgi:hypothetical protein
MTKREQYHLSFQKIVVDGSVYNAANQIDNSYPGLSSHITSSNITYTNAQISAVIKEQNTTGSDFFWDEVKGSALYFHSNHTVEIGDAGTILPVEDFKQLLQEWLTFIS